MLKRTKKNKPPNENKTTKLDEISRIVFFGGVHCASTVIKSFELIVFFTSA